MSPAVAVLVATSIALFALGSGGPETSLLCGGVQVHCRADRQLIACGWVSKAGLAHVRRKRGFDGTSAGRELYTVDHRTQNAGHIPALGELAASWADLRHDLSRAPGGSGRLLREILVDLVSRPHSAGGWGATALHVAEIDGGYRRARKDRTEAARGGIFFSVVKRDRVTCSCTGRGGAQCKWVGANGQIRNSWLTA